MASDFKAGDVVQLKSGGPRMTVTQVGDALGTPTVWCVWFTDKGDEKKGTYPPDALEQFSN